MNKNYNNNSYERVFAKAALNMPLNEAEVKTFNLNNPKNEYRQSANNTSVVIPDGIAEGITSTMNQLHPILSDITPTEIKGTVSFPKQKAVKEGDADYYLENEETASEENEFGELILEGKELSKLATVTWRLQSMSIESFIPYLERELGERMAHAKANAFVRGAGNENYPLGVITALNEQPDTPQIIEHENQLTYEDLTRAISKLSSINLPEAKLYANKATVWNTLANVTDEHGRPVFIPHVDGDSVGRVLGVPVREESAMKDDEILIGNMARGYRENIQQRMLITTVNNAKARKTDFVAYEVHDGGVMDEEAFVYIRPLGI